MTEHTPGPWQYGVTAKGKRGVFLSDGSCIAVENEANARLIAAAPDLLEVVTVLLKAWDCDEEYDTLHENLLDHAVGKARIVIAKISGGTDVPPG